MTCKEFHNGWERGVSPGAGGLPGSTEMAEHASACPECSGFLRDEQVLEKHLALVRVGVPEVPASLDSAVVGNYRRYLAERPVAIDRRGWRVPLENALPWAAALAFAALVAYGAIVFFMPRSSTGWANGKSRTPVGQTPLPVRAEPQVSPPIETAKPQRSPRRTPNPGESLQAAAGREDGFPPAFRSLLYCDQISCPGAMEVIRVELPAPVLGLAQTPARAGGTVSADVLVGADGIARGIRVVE